MSREDGHGSLSAIVRALRLTSIASIITIAFGVGTNKVIAVVAGTTGVALIGVYRTVVSIVTGVLQLGLTDRATQKLSLAREGDESRQIIGAALALCWMQSIVVVALAVVAAGPISSWIFGRAEAGGHVWEVRWVLATTTGVLALQMVTALLNGQTLLRETTAVGMVTSAATVATVYPLLLLGRVGLAFVIGATCFVGAGLGLFYLVRRNRLGVRDVLFAGRWRQALRVLPLSASLTLEPLVITGSALATQSLLVRHYGMDELGLYNAATLLEGTAVMVLTSSMRSYFVPTLARFEHERDKHRFLNRMLLILTLVVIAAVAALVFIAPLAIRILFSSRFVGASTLVGILGISIVGQIYGWCYAMFFLHRAEFATRLAIETVWATATVTGIWYCTARALPLPTVAWVIVGSYTLLAAMHVSVAVARHGRGMISGVNIAVGVAGIAGLTAVVLLRR